MSIRIATFNMENLFTRPSVMNLDTWTDGREILADVSKLNSLLAKEDYSDADKAKIAEILEKYDFHKTGVRRRPFAVNQTHGKLFVAKKQPQRVDVVARGRKDWTGWIELARDEIRWEATENTARVVDAIRSDIIVAVEVEDRLTLQRFSDQVLGELFQVEFPYNMLVDGNDERGIDIGLYSRFPIRSVRSHITDSDDQGRVFSRDCPEFEVELPGGQTLWVLGNHFKSKGYGSPAVTSARRVRQAERVKELYTAALERSELVIVAGDLNDTPDSPAIQSLVDGTGMQDVMTHPAYQGKPGTYASGNSANQKIDYLFLSPALWGSVQTVDVERRGIYAPNAGNPFPSVTSKATQASDHGALWVELDL